jgi:hypothetical protein
MSGLFVRDNLFRDFCILKVENRLISSLTDYCKHTNEGKILKMVIWTVLDLCSLISNRAGGPGLTALHRADQALSRSAIGRGPGAVDITCSVLLPKIAHI